MEELAGFVHPHIAVVVVNFGSSDLLRVNLRPLEGDPDLDIVIVDNYSTEAERVAVRQVSERAWNLVSL